jgi:hypothetical protein
MPWYGWVIIVTLALGVGVLLVLYFKARSTPTTPENTVPQAVHDAEVKNLQGQLEAEKNQVAAQVAAQKVLQDKLVSIQSWYETEKAKIDVSSQKKIDELLAGGDSAISDEWDRRFGSGAKS